jgi:transcriptional regulator with XRE-family HTH domain
MMRTEPTIDVRVGQRLARARKAAGLTLQELADRLRWPLSTLDNYETGRRPIKLAHLEAISAALNRSPAAFLVDSDEASMIIEQISVDQERCLQVLFFLEALTEPVGEDGEPQAEVNPT